MGSGKRKASLAQKLLLVLEKIYITHFQTTIIKISLYVKIILIFRIRIQHLAIFSRAQKKIRTSVFIVSECGIIRKEFGKIIGDPEGKN